MERLVRFGTLEFEANEGLLCPLAAPLVPRAGCMGNALRFQRMTGPAVLAALATCVACLAGCGGGGSSADALGFDLSRLLQRVRCEWGRLLAEPAFVPRAPTGLRGADFYGAISSHQR